MMAEVPKVDFALGSEVSPSSFFKSTFARNFINSGCRDYKSLDYYSAEDIGNNNNSSNSSSSSSSRFFSLAPNLTNKSAAANGGAPPRIAALRESKEAPHLASDANELEKLRKQYQLLKKENRRLHSAFLQNGFLQARVDTLQWQCKQVESNRQMYRSVMEQVAHFLDRVYKSLEILHDKDISKDKRRVPRSRSVHTVVRADPSPSRASTSSPSPSNSSRFTRAKSVTHMSPSVNGIRDFTWSVLCRNDPVHCTSPRINKPPQDLNKSHDDIVYREPKQSELNPDEIPPEKLSQEAFRLLRLVDSLLATREPDLARVTPVEDNQSSPSPTDRHHYHDISLQSGNFVNSTSLQETVHAECSSNSHGHESSSIQSDSSLYFVKSPMVTEIAPNLQASLPRARRSPDVSSLNSGSSKTTEEEDTIATAKQLEKKDPTSACKIKSPVSVSSADSESGISSISSFMDVGLPPVTSTPFTPVKGCHTEIGLPEVPLSKSGHRRWTSAPAELQELYKQFYRQHMLKLDGLQTPAESISVCWV